MSIVVLLHSVFNRCIPSKMVDLKLFYLFQALSIYTTMSFIIRLSNLSRHAKSADIRQFFSSLSIPGGSVCIVGGDTGEAFIGFSTDEDARQAMLRDGQVLCNNRIKLSFSSRKEMQEAMERAQQLSNLLKNVEKVINTEGNKPGVAQKPFPVTQGNPLSD